MHKTFEQQQSKQHLQQKSQQPSVATLQVNLCTEVVIVEQSLLVVQLTARAQRCVILTQDEQQGNGEGSSKRKGSTGDASTSVLAVGEECLGWDSVQKVPGAVGGENVQHSTNG